MVRVSIEVNTAAARFSLAVRAESIRQALSIAEALYPGADAQVVFPIEPEGFFVEDPAVMPGSDGLEMARDVVV